MTTKQIADQLVAMCRDGKIEEAKIVFFTEETISIEPSEGILPKEVKGLKAIQQKAELFISMVDEFYGISLTEPVIAGDYFSLGWETDIKMKDEDRKLTNEICLYQVKDSKIIAERFFY